MYLHVVANIYESLSQLKNNWHKQMHGSKSMSSFSKERPNYLIRLFYLTSCLVYKCNVYPKISENNIGWDVGPMSVY